MIEVKKAEAARLTDLLDEPPALADALRDVLRRVIADRGRDLQPADDVFVVAGAVGGWDDSRSASVAALDPDALVRLAVDLCELRTIEVDR